jgi:cholesterol 25-hydroxylase
MVDVTLWIVRLISILFLGIIYGCPHLLQTIVDDLYMYLYNSSVFRISSFETWWTVLWFMSLEDGYLWLSGLRTMQKYRIDIRNGHPIEIRRWVEMYRLRELFQYIIPVLMLDLTMIKKYSGVSLEKVAMVSRRDARELSPSFLIINTGKASSIWNLTSWIQTHRTLPETPPTIQRLITEVMVAVIIFDFLFFIAHFTLHRFAFLYHQFHQAHHRHSEINARVTNQLDFVERAILLISANFALNVIGAHVLSRTVFVPVFLGLLTDIHSGLDLPLAYDKILGKYLAGGAKRHAMHHRCGDKYYQPFFRYMDDALDYMQWGKHNKLA